MRLRLLLFVFVMTLCCAAGSTAELSLTITRPVSDFTTNNQTLRVEGVVESSTPAKVVVSTNTPAGVPSLSELAHSLHAVVLDLGDSWSLRGVIIHPVADHEFSRGPRRARVAFSQDGVNFSQESRFNVSSTPDPILQGTVIDFSSPVSAQFVEIEMLEGWQSGPIAVEAIEFLSADNQVIQGRIQVISIRLDVTAQRRAFFALEILLAEGENRLSLLARELAPSTTDAPEITESRTISLFYLPELRPEAAEAFILSDGGKATVVIPSDAFDERIKRLEIFALPPEEIDRLSYLRNTRIVKGAAPVVAYRFEARRQSAFAAEATNALPNQPPALAVDGILEPPSTWIAGLVSLPISITIDLGLSRTVSRMVVHARVDGDISFAPQRARILASNDNENFVEVQEVETFQDETTALELSTRPSARYFRLEITESKQANNVQLNEIEFFDESSAKIVSFETFEHLSLTRPMLLELSYTGSDLVAANVAREEDLKVFAWDPLAREWQLAGGELNLNRRTIRLELNYISQVALFQAVPSQIQATWSFNPFSPDGNGVADVTRLTIFIPETLQVGQAELTVELFNLQNQLVRTLINRTVMNTRSISVEWDGADQTGQIVRIGPYIYQIQLASQISNGVIVVGK